MAGPDRRPDLGGDETARVTPDVEDKLARTGRAVEPHGRREVTRRKAGKLHAEILPGMIVERRGQRDDDLKNIGRKRRYAGDDAGALGDLRDMVEGDRCGADDLGLAGE